VAVYALFTGDIDDEETASARDVNELSDRVNGLDGELDSTLEGQDEQQAELGRITTRLDEIDQSVSDLRAQTREPSAEVQSVSNQVDDLESRIQDLEADPDAGGSAGAGSGVP
jgi:chromosome segregation ATPase